MPVIAICSLCDKEFSFSNDPPFFEAQADILSRHEVDGLPLICGTCVSKLPANLSLPQLTGSDKQKERARKIRLNHIMTYGLHSYISSFHLKESKVWIAHKADVDFHKNLTALVELATEIKNGNESKRAEYYALVKTLEFE